MPRPAPTRSWYARVLDSARKKKEMAKSKSKKQTTPGASLVGLHTGGRLGSLARHHGTATEFSVQDKSALVSSGASRTTGLSISAETQQIKALCTCRIRNPDTTRAGRVGAVHGGAAGRRGGAGLGRTGCRWVDSARKQNSFSPSSTSRTLSSRFSWNYEHSNSYLKSTEEQKNHG